MKEIIKKISGLIMGHPNSSVAWMFRTITLVLLIKLAFFNEPNVQTNFRHIPGYEDSLMIERHKIKILEELVIKNYEKNEKDSIALTVASLDSLIRYIANKNMDTD